MRGRFSLFVALALSLGLLLPAAMANSAQAINASETPTDRRTSPTAAEVLTILLEDPLLTVVFSDGVRLPLPLKATTVAIEREDGNHTFLDDLTRKLAGEQRDWFAVLRGAGGHFGAHAAVVLRPDSYDVIVNLATGTSIRTSRADSPGILMVRTDGGNAGLSLELLLEEMAFPASAGADALESLDLSGVVSSFALPDVAEAGSIQVSKHIYHDGERIDPTNVIFYHEMGFFQSVLEEVGWIAKWGCGTAKDLKLYDKDHGGADGWYIASMDWAFPDVC